MPIDLSKLVSTESLGKVRASVAIGQLVAKPNFRPHDWQSPAPETTFAGNKPPVQSSAELDRIKALPRRPPPDTTDERAAALVELMTARFRRDNPNCECMARFGRDCITTLRAIQAIMLYELGLEGGGVGSIGTGFGKTLIDLLAPLALDHTHGCKTALVLMPSNLVEQFVNDYDLVGQHFRMPSLIVCGSHVMRLVEGVPTLYVLGYPRLSHEKATALLSEIRPDFIICDEFQNLAGRDSVRTKRVMRYADQNEDTIRGLIMSGSLTGDKLMDMAHGFALALRLRSPLPVQPDVCEDWDRAVHAGKWPAPAGALLELCEPGEHVQSGLHRRIFETRGCIRTSEPSIDAELRVDERRPGPIPYEVQSALDELRNSWLRPDGEVLMDALSVSRVARELACGFYLYWFFPKVHGKDQLRSHIDAWLEARKQYRLEVRDVLRSAGEHMDSPLLVTKAAMRFHGDLPYDEAERLAQGLPPLPVWESQCWPAWRDIRKTVEYRTETQRFHPYLAADAAKWGQSERGLIWYRNPSFGAWISELSGLPMYGAQGDRLKDENGKLKERGERSIILSSESYGVGFDGLQFWFDNQLCTQPSSSAVKWEQQLGRTFRIHQRSEVVRASVYRHTEELAEAVDNAVARAQYVQRLMGSPQKLLAGFKATGRLADWDRGYDESEASIDDVEGAE